MSESGFKRKSGSWAWATGSALWLLAASAGLYAMGAYSFAAGRNAESRLAAQGGAGGAMAGGGRATLVMLVHPHCACSRASLAELAVLMSRLKGRVEGHVLLARMEGAERGWEKTALWRQATAIPGVRVRVDEGGREARRLGVWTSGDTLVYDAEGRLIFEGGLTAARGHEGSNAGRSAIEGLILAGASDVKRTPVFGCSIFAEGEPEGMRRALPGGIGPEEAVHKR